MAVPNVRAILKGAMQTGLVGPLWSRVRDQAEESAERLESAINLASSLFRQGKDAEAVEQMRREVHSMRMRALGPEHPKTLHMANDAAKFLACQGKYAARCGAAPARDAWGAEARAPGPERPSTLTTVQNLAEHGRGGLKTLSRASDAPGWMRKSVAGGPMPRVGAACDARARCARCRAQSARVSESDGATGQATC